MNKKVKTGVIAVSLSLVYIFSIAMIPNQEDLIGIQVKKDKVIEPTTLDQLTKDIGLEEEEVIYFKAEENNSEGSPSHNFMK